MLDWYLSIFWGGLGAFTIETYLLLRKKKPSLDPWFSISFVLFAIYCGAVLAFLVETRYSSNEPIYVFGVGVAWELTLSKMYKPSMSTEVKNREVMKRIDAEDCSFPNDGLLDALEQMEKLGIDRIPVVEGPNSKRVIGMLTNGRVKRTLEDFEKANININQAVISEYMIPVNQLAKIDENESISHAIQMMLNREIRKGKLYEKGIRAMPVINKQGHIKGIVSLEDLLEFDKSRW
jgi:CBS domain-containing protein